MDTKSDVEFLSGTEPTQGKEICRWCGMSGVRCSLSGHDGKLILKGDVK